MSWWGGREHFITVRVERLSDVCIYFEGRTGASVGAGDEDSGIGESEEAVDDEGESSRERLGIAYANVAVRRLLLISLAPYAISSHARYFPQRNFKKSPVVYSVLDSGIIQAGGGGCCGHRLGHKTWT